MFEIPLIKSFNMKISLEITPKEFYWFLVLMIKTALIIFI